ncbi:MAG: hypothetical protein KA408_02720 [Flavobacteriales bacterium]|nr:hypothetical protein [Flavobacteriales bacterium]
MELDRDERVDVYTSEPQGHPLKCSGQNHRRTGLKRRRKLVFGEYVEFTLRGFSTVILVALLLGCGGQKHNINKTLDVVDVGGAWLPVTVRVDDTLLHCLVKTGTLQGYLAKKGTIMPYPQYRRFVVRSILRNEPVVVERKDLTYYNFVPYSCPSDIRDQRPSAIASKYFDRHGLITAEITNDSTACAVASLVRSGIVVRVDDESGAIFVDSLALMNIP